MGWHRPHLLVVMRLPLTNVVEVETERKPSPASAPELKDEVKKSREGSNKVGARVGGKRRAGDRLCTGEHGVLGLPCWEEWQHLLPEDPGKGEKKWPPPWCRGPGPRSSEKGSTSSERQRPPHQHYPIVLVNQKQGTDVGTLCQGQP